LSSSCRPAPYGYDSATTWAASTANWGGLKGPDGLVLAVGDHVVWRSDSSGTRGGFKICVGPSSNGGGVAINGGTASFVNTNVTNNFAILYGGGIYNDGGSLTLTDSELKGNIASEGEAITYDAGSITATGVDIGASAWDVITGGSAVATRCQSPCVAGEFGTCDVASGTSLCFINCQCTKCPAGKVSTVVGATSDTCTFCGAGQVSAAGDTTCTACVAGQYATGDPTDTGGGLVSQISLGATSCNDCPAGYFASAGSSIVCEACAAGKYSGIGATVCPDCAAGAYSSSAYATCTVCIAGFKTSLASAATACTACDAGQTSNAGSVSCTNCVAGTYSPAGAASCTDCAPGSFNDAPGLGVCSDCPGNTYSDAGSSECLLCLRYFYYSLLGECVACPVGTSCEEDGGSTQENLIVLEGYWRISPNAYEIWPCPLLGSCVGNADFVDEGNGYCTEGYVGPLCAVCDPDGFYLNTDDLTCTACPTSGTSITPTMIIIGVCLAAFAVMMIFFFIKASTKPPGSERSAVGAAKEKIAELNRKREEMKAKIEKRMAPIIDPIKKLSDSVKINSDGSIEFKKVKKEPEKVEVKEATKIKTNATATIVTTTVVTTTTNATATTTTVVKPAGNLIALAAKIKEAQVKLKALTSFSQISVSVAFNCSISFPTAMTKLTDSLSVVNLDVVPKLQLQCRFSGFDYVDKMVVQCMGPIFISAFLGLVFVYLKVKAALAGKISVKQQKAMEAYSAPAELLAKFSEKELESFKKMYFKYDADNSGTIDRSELGDVFREFDESATEEQVRAHCYRARSLACCCYCSCSCCSCCSCCVMRAWC